MGFRQADSENRGGYARLWSVEDKGNYSVAKVSTSKKRKDDDGYDTDFQDGFVRLVGSAHEKAKTLKVTEKGVSIQITSCDVTTPYDEKTKKSYVNYVIFAFDVPENSTSTTKGKKTTAKPSKAKTTANTEIDEDEDLPF